jgi:hypothetical protein
MYKSHDPIRIWGPGTILTPASLSFFSFEMSTLLKSSTIRPERTALIRSYPWSHGIPLVENRRDFLENGWRNTHHAKPVVQLALVRVLSHTTRQILLKSLKSA